MDPIFVVDPLVTGKFYAFIYLLSFSFAFLFLLTERRRHHLPLLPWLVLTTVAFLFFIIGCQSVTLSGSEWAMIFNGEKFYNPVGRSVLGGILFGVPAMFLAAKWLKFPTQVLDSFGFVALIALSIQRIGCMLAGCCFGTPTTVPWAIAYSTHSHAFVQQLSNRHVTMDAIQSLSIHPVQLYETMGCLIILIALLRIRKNVKAPGNVFVLSILLYCILRFFIQFFRTSEIGGEFLYYLDVKQWFTMVAAVLLSLIFCIRERKQHLLSDYQVKKVTSEAALLFFFSISLLFLFVSKWLSSIEIIAINIVLIPTLLLVGWKIFIRVTVYGMRLVSLLLIGGSFLMMSQTLPEYAVDSDSTMRAYNTFSFGTLGGVAKLSYIQEDCDGNPVSTTQLDNIYSAIGAGFSRSKQLNLRENLTYGINAYVGTHQEKVSNAVTGSQHLTFYGINPFIQYDRKRIGIGVGVHAGDISKIISAYEDGGYYNFSSVRRYALYPSFSFRYGNLKKVFTEIKFANQFPTSFPAQELQLSIGFGLEKGSVLRFGSSSFSGLFIYPTIILNEHFMLEPWVGVGGGWFNSYKQEANIMGSVSLHYRFYKKEK